MEIFILLGLAAFTVGLILYRMDELEGNSTENTDEKENK